MFRKTPYLILSIIVMLALNISVRASADNLLLNPGFEEGSSHLPDLWGRYDWESEQGVTEFKVDTQQTYSGLKSVRIINNSPNDSRFKQQVSCDSDSYYKLSCWVKTEDVGNDAKGANISLEGIVETSRDIRGSSQGWQYIELYGITHKDQNSFTITLGLGGYGSLNTGKAWFDEVSVEKLDKLPPEKTIINLYSSDEYSTPDNKGISLFVIVLGVLFAGLVGVLVYLTLKGIKNSKPLSSQNEHPRPYAQPSAFKLDRTDFKIMYAMTIIYLIFALFNLGSLKSPQTFWQPAKSGESFDIDFGRRVNLSRIIYHTNVGRATYLIEYQDESGKLVSLTNLELDNYNVFKWRHTDASASTSRLRITTDLSALRYGEEKGMINELGFFEQGSKQPLQDITIVENNTSNEGKGGVQNLFDEQNTLLYNPTYLDHTYFDEIYHARTAYEHLHGLNVYEWTHPPFGKILISLGIVVFGMNPFGWRIAGTIVGALMIPVMYAFGKKMFTKRFYGFCSAFLMTFDFMHFTQTRIATIDVYVTFFVILMFYYMYDYFMRKSYLIGFKMSLKPLFLSGLFFGFGAASKWIAFYGAAGLALLFFIAKALETRDYIRIKSDSSTRDTPWLKRFIPCHMSATMLLCILFFIIIPVAIYILSFTPYPDNSLSDVWKYQERMYNYHSKLVAEHDFASVWWQWPIIYRPIWYYSGSELAQGHASTIVAMGNPAVWWTGIAAVLASAIIAFCKRDKAMLVVFAAITAQYMPWVLVSRLTFIYHYFSIVPFIILSIVYIIKNALEKFPESRYSIYAYLGLTAGLFILFYPALSGYEVSKNYIYMLRWFGSWTF